jgi:lysophospholipase L1-like esterase
VALAVTVASCSPTPGPRGEHYVALGDSYAAGPLTGQLIGNPPGCLRSDRNYAHVAADRLAAATFRDVTCSGATTADLVNPQTVLDGVNPPQVDALAASTTLVTLTIGGNDVGFSEVLERCASLVPTGSPCKTYFSGGGVDTLAGRIAAAAPRVAAALGAVRGRAPEARILLVGYPDLLPASGGCWPIVPITDTDADYLRASEIALNAMLAAQAGAAGVQYVDTYARSVGHDMCQASDVRWIEPLFPTSPALPFHPNAKGEAQMADAVLAAVRSETR